MKICAQFTRHNGLWHVLVTPVDDDGYNEFQALEGYSLKIRKRDGEKTWTLLGPMCCSTNYQARYTIGGSPEQESEVGYEGDGRYSDICSILEDPEWEKV